MRSKIAPMLWVVLLAGVPVALFASYFFIQRQRIVDLDQRELGRAAENLRQILRNSAETVVNLGRQPGYTCSFAEKQPYLEVAGGDCKDFGTAADLPPDTGTAMARKTDVWYTAGESGLMLATGITATNGRLLSFNVRLEKVLDELLVGDNFEYLFVADETGRVLFQLPRGERKRWLDQLHWLERMSRDETLASPGPLRLRNLDELQQSDGSKIKFADLNKTTNSVEVQIAQKLRRIHLQPIQDLSQLDTRKHTGADTTAQKAPVIFLGGVVDSSASVAQALAIEPLYALGLALLIAFGLLTLPLIKFLLLAPRERFRFVDFHLLALSTAASIGLATIVVLAADNYYGLTSFSDRRLTMLSDGILREFNHEVANMATQLSAYDQAMLTIPRDKKCVKTLDITLLLAGGKKEPHVQPPKAYPNLESVFWARNDGEQFAKMTPFDGNSPMVNVAARPYFRGALEGRLWSFRDSPSGSTTPHFFLQPLRSITTGAFETGISMKSGITGCTIPGTEGKPSVAVAVLTTNLMSLGPHALPPDLGFMIIDRSGSVLYHSDQRRALREDLFEETGNPEQLRSIILGGGTEWLRTTYRTVHTRFYVRPIDTLVGAGDQRPAGWYLVAFRNLELDRTAGSEAVLLSVLWASFYFLIVEFAPAMVFVFLGPGRAAWLWPSPEKQGMYARLAAELALLSAGAMILLVFTQGWMTLVAGTLTGVATGGLATWEFRRSVRRASSVAGHRRSRWLGRTAVASLALFAASVLPAAACFKFAWNERIAALVSYDSDETARAASDLRQSTDERLRQQLAGAYGPQWVDIAKPLKRDDKDFTPLPMLAAERATGRPDPIASRLPVYSDFSAALRFQRTSDTLAAGAGLAMRPGLLSLLAGCLIAAILIVWIRYADKHLFLSGFADLNPVEVDFADAIRKARETRGNLLIVVSSSAFETAIRTAAATGTTSLAAAAGASTSSVAQTADEQPLFDLTDAVPDSEARLALLGNLERETAKGGAIVFSRFEPTPILLTGEGGVPSPTAINDAERRRWSDLLQRVSILRTPVDHRLVAAAECGAEGAAVRSDCEALYWDLWSSCTDTEKVMLIQVAEEGFGNPRDTRVVQDLLRRGMLVLGPDLRPFSEGFQAFIKRTYDRNWISPQERPEGRIGWVQARWIVVAVFVTLALFLVATQRQALTPMVGFVTTLVGALGGVMKLISDAGPKRT